MKFIFADALDMIDPDYDFASDRPGKGRSPYWSDKYPHEYFPKPPYDGVLISKGIVGDQNLPGKYTESQSMRFRRVGAREFLRLNRPEFKNLQIFGDSGAFSYVTAERPPYTTDQLLEFYDDGKFTHGCSLDHVIFDFEPNLLKGLRGGSKEARNRYEITQENARAFLKSAKRIAKTFTPLGVVQGWSPGSMAQAARSLERMGYSYLSVGGMVPLSSASVHLCLSAIREVIKPSTKLHVLGFAKAEEISEFSRYGIASFDSTSPLIRAFKDARANYYVRGKGISLNYYTAVRIPHATENSRLKIKAKQGDASQEQLAELEAAALRAVRALDRGKNGVNAALRSILAYTREFVWDSKSSSEANERKLDRHAADLKRTLEDRPWQRCLCRVCRQAGVEVMIFRSSNRNKRRGFHNLSVYYEHFRRAVQ